MGLVEYLQFDFLSIIGFGCAQCSFLIGTGNHPAKLRMRHCYSSNPLSWGRDVEFRVGAGEHLRPRVLPLAGSPVQRHARRGPTCVVSW